MRLTSSVVLALLITAAFGEPKLRNGFAVSVGVGNRYGANLGAGEGVGLEYQLLLAPRVRLTPFVGAGLVGEAYSGASQTVGYCGGISLECGRWQRAFVGLSFGSLFRDSSVAPAEIETRVGPALSLGYKGMARFGLFWQVFVSGAYIVNPTNDPSKKNTTVAPDFGLGLGYKL